MTAKVLPGPGAGDSRRWYDQAPAESVLWHMYDTRARAVYWHNEPACRAKGPGKADCLLTPGHPGDHYGNGYDQYGPQGPIRWEKK